MWLIVGYALGVGEVAFSEEENVLWCHRMATVLQINLHHSTHSRTASQTKGVTLTQWKSVKAFTYNGRRAGRLMEKAVED